MKTAKRIILILLPVVLLMGALLLDPLVRFVLALRLNRANDAAAVYSAHILVSERLEQKAKEQLREFVERHRDRYFQKELTYDQVMSVLFPLSQTNLPQEDIERCIQAVEERERARRDLIEADTYAANGAYAHAIPFYRQALSADESAVYRLQQAEAAYKIRLLDEAEAAMDAGEYRKAESVLLDGLSVLVDDDDLTRARMDVSRMEADAVYDARIEEARRCLREDGPEAAFGYLADLQAQAPDEYGIRYMEQLLFHEYEEDICARALSLQAKDDPKSACALLEEGLRWIDSDRMKTLRGEIRAAITYWLGDMPVLRDETADARTGAASTVIWDQAEMDSLANAYQHSLTVDLGSINFSLKGEFAVFVGTVACPMGETSDIYQASATLQVFGDGRLIAEFKDVDSASLPIPFSIPVEGVQELALQWTSEGANGWRDWGRFATVFDGRLLSSVGN